MQSLDLISKEITELHEFFQNYFSGSIEQSEIKRLENVIDEEFLLITPTAKYLDRSSLLEVISSSYGKSSSKRIWVENIKIKCELNDHLLVTYEECQLDNDISSCRISSTIFKSDETAVNNYKWLHLHETLFQDK